MGVPKFFRYISERYPCLSELAREQCIPDFDNMYLDMNGIIHNCSHPDDTNIHFNITEEQMFKDIFNYIDKLFFLIKPRKLFFMAVDGVAPRAKMNQQRSRRFRSAKDAEQLEERAKLKGEVIEHERFDSNCITPGTEFMSRLQEALRYFIKSKISSDSLWQKCRIILSGHDAPGEGEHKIMDYIRYLKSQPGYDPNTRHCLYGLDADLIILGLCTHELHFVVLREEVKFGRNTKRASVEETRFYLLHLGLMREYLELEFNELRKQDPNFDIAKLIDDWVLMGFMVGNDFIPHLPCMHINSNALPLLYKTYIKVYPQLGGNLNEHGKLNLERLEKYFAALSEVEYEIFQENYADLKYFEAKQTKNGIDEAFDFDVNEINNENTDNDLAELIENSKQFLADDDEDLSDEEQHISDEFETYKRNYYMNKLNQNVYDTELKREQAICYITALQWVLDYYYRGVQSWDWYYPHHYAPFISDLKNFKDYQIQFNLGKPFLPFEQLLAVLPAASKELLPSAFRDLMTSESSAVIDFYPRDFETDLNGKQQEWEAVVLIPFIDEKKLLHAMKACESDLTPSEVKRNRHGPMFQYDYVDESQGTVPGIYSLKSLSNVFCTEKPIWSTEINLSTDTTVCVELPNAARHVFFPGFPTMKHLKFNFELRHARAKVFDYASRNENMILLPENRPSFHDVFTVAEKYLNQVVFIGWPHLIKSKVVAVFSKDKNIDADGIKSMDERLFNLHKSTTEEHLTTRMGIVFDDTSVLVQVRTHIGTTYVCGNQGKVIVNDAWSQITTTYPAQGVVAEIEVFKDLQLQHKKIEHLFPVDSKIFFVGNPYFGSEGTVLNPMLVYECGRLKVNITVLPEPDFSDAKQTQTRLEMDYANTYNTAAIVGIHAKCLGRVTGTVLVVPGEKQDDIPTNVRKINIGLQFKYPKQNEELAGYARRISNQWYYSSKAVELLKTYHEKFPMVFDYLSNSGSEYCFEVDLFPQEMGKNRLEEIVSWLKSQEHTQAEKIACGSKTLEKEAVEKVLDSIEQLKTLPVKTVKLQVKPHLLLKPDISLPDFYRSKRPIKLFDRVVVVKTTYMVPLGSKGTVIGIYPAIDPNPVRLECVKVVHNFYEVLFDKHLPGGNDIFGIAQERVYKIPESSVLLIFNQESKASEMLQDAKLNQFMSDNSATNTRRGGANAGTSADNKSYYNSNTSNADNMFESPGSSGGRRSNALPIINPKTMNQVLVPTAQNARETSGSDDFWMPAADKKVKHTQVPLFITANANRSTRTNYNSNSNTATQSPRMQLNFTPPVTLLQKSRVGENAPNIKQSETHERAEETKVLKNLLGLTKEMSGASVKSSPSKPAQPQLPQPPLGWRSDAQNAQHPAQGNRSGFPQMQPRPMQSMRPPTAPVAVIGGNFVPLHMAHPAASVMPQYMNPPAYFPRAPAPQYSANEKFFSPDSLNQKGAFIPLQAMRQNTNQPNNLSTNTNVPNVEEMQNRFHDINIDATAIKQENANADTNMYARHAANERKKPPRVPKIGAKFDNAH